MTNEYSKGILVEFLDGGFGLYDSLDFVQSHPEILSRCAGGYQDVTWRMGDNNKPVVRLPDGSEVEIK